MGDRISVTPEELKKTGEELLEKSRLLEVNYSEIFEKVEALGNAWKGDGYDAYRLRVTSFKDELDSLKSLIVTYSQFLDNTYANYSNAEGQIIQGIKDMR